MSKIYPYFSRNGQLLTIDKAVVPLDSVEYSYGFGVYETIRVTKSIPNFLDEHCARLMASAAAIGLEHLYESKIVQTAATDLLTANKVEACNLKILLVGGSGKETASLYILCLNPLFPDRKLYKSGVHTITKSVERPFPQAKTLNMLPSFLAFRAAKQAGAYDALCVNREGYITEGTRTNFFVVKDNIIISPPRDDILPGVTRNHVLQVARQNKLDIREQNIPLADIANFDGAFLTSTSSKLMPIRSIDDHIWDNILPVILELIKAFDEFTA
jgi:branched-subunit amino acid aminotransferase/4-amino-4-deoxychorismate lyase